MQTERPTASSDDATIDLLAMVGLLLRRRAPILAATAAAAVASVVVSLLLPNVYSATAKILPPQQDAAALTAFLPQVGGLGGMAGSLLGAGSSSDLYAGILDSETIKDAVIDRYSLMQLYETEKRSDAYRAFDKAVNVSVGKKDGIISISVEDRDPRRAASMANSLVDELKKMSVRMNASNAKNSRVFFEKRLEGARGDLAAAEAALRTFQTEHKTLDVPEQTKASLEGIVGLRAQLAVREVELATLRRSYTDSSQEVQRALAGMEGLKEQIDRLEGNRKGGAIPSIGSVPALGEQYVRLMRDLKVREGIVEYLTKQFEASQLAEAQETSSIFSVQEAKPPDRKSKPRRTYIVAGTTILAFFSSVAFVLIREFSAAARLWSGARSAEGTARGANGGPGA